MKTVVLILSFIPFIASAQLKGPLEEMRGLSPGIETVDREKLMELLHEALGQYPNQPAQYNDLGAANYHLQQYDSALVNLNKAIKLSENYAEAIYNRGIVKLKLQDYKGALEDFNFLIKNNEKDAASYFHRGIAYYYGGNREKGVEDLKKAIELDPKFEWAYYNLAFIEFEERKFTDAILHLTKAIEINGKDAEYYATRGFAYQMSEDIKAACADFKKSAELGNAAVADRAKSCE